MRTSAFIRIIIYVVVAVICVSLLVVGLVGGSFRGLRGINLGLFSYNLGNDEGYTASSSGEIDLDCTAMRIDWISGSVQIETYGGNTIKFYEESNTTDPDLQMRYKYDNGTLNIHYARTGNFNLGVFDNVIKKLYIQVPANTSLVVLSVDAVSAPIKINGLDAVNLKVDTTSGNVNIAHMSSDTIDINTVSGKIDLSDVKANYINLDSVSGNHNIKGEVERISSNTTSGEVNIICTKMLREADLDTVSGSMTIYLPENDGFKVNWDSVSGKFNCDFPITYQNSSATYGNGSASIKMNTVSGRMSIKQI